MRINQTMTSGECRKLPSVIPLKSPSPDHRCMNVIIPTKSPNILEIKKRSTPVKNEEKENRRYLY
jgi:hypothetical protein